MAGGRYIGPMRCRWSPFAVAASAALVCLAGMADPRHTSQAEEPGKPPAREESKGEAEAPRLYTNRDLEPLPPPSKDVGDGSAAHPAKATAQVDPLRRIQDDQGRALNLRRLMAEARKQLRAAEARVKALEQRILRISNPQLPRPELDHPELGGGMTDEEKKEVEGLDNVERRRLAEEQLEEARKALREARAALEKLGSGS